MPIHIDASRGTPSTEERSGDRRSIAPQQPLSPDQRRLRNLSRTANASIVQRVGGTTPVASAERASAPNRTGLPDTLKAGVEALSGLSMDHVRVVANSPRPAAFGALAYAQGSEIHLSPGQERHLPHEAWHVVQQQQGRVATLGHFSDGSGYNDDAGLEREADVMGSRASRPQTSASFPAAGLAAGRSTDGAPIQGMWRCIVDGSSRRMFWRNDKDGDVPDAPPPSAWAGYTLVTEMAAQPYYPAEERARRGAEPALGLEQWTVQYGKSQRAPSDVYNPFGRFRSHGIVSFVSARDDPGFNPGDLGTRLSAADANIQPPNWTLTQQLWSRHPEAGVRNAFGYPAAIVTAGGRVVLFTAADAFGAIYTEQVPIPDRAQADDTKVTAAADLKWAPGVPEEPEYMQATASVIDANTIKAWSGKERSKQQAEVMGMSAGAAASAAGFDPNEGEGWEWLHLVAHSMGGVDYDGPQVATNLVAGTSECNTQMIVIEEMLKDLVIRTDGHAKLVVQATMLDAARHIGAFITYDFVLFDKDGNMRDVYHYRFDCLSRNRPLVAENRITRYAGRTAFGVAEKGENTGHVLAPSASKFDPASLREKPLGGGLEEDEITAALDTMRPSRLAEIGIMLGLASDKVDRASLLERLAAQPFDLVFDLVRASSVDVAVSAVGETIDARLAVAGMRRNASDSTGFICLIDSISQLLADQGLEVDRAALIMAVNAATGRRDGEMLEIIGVEGSNVLAAVEALLFQRYGRHFSLLAHVRIVMPDGSLVPFYRANALHVPGGEQIELDLLFINNNHYEPLFALLSTDTTDATMDG